MRPVAMFLVISVIAVVVSACSSPGGILLPDGRITPCPDWHTDNQACGYALFNARVIGQVRLGQTQDDVRTIMKHAPERREASMSDGRRSEIWMYITDYQAELMTALTFTDGVLTSIGQAPWKQAK